MEKESIIEHLRNAKMAHLKWVQRAKSLISNIPIKEEAIPLDYTECAFGKWFYTEAQELALMPGMDCIKLIEEKHTELHNIYFKIFKIYFSDTNRSFFSKMLNLRKKVSTAEQDIAQEYYVELEETSKELLGYIERLERRVSALSDTFFQRR